MSPRPAMRAMLAAALLAAAAPAAAQEAHASPPPRSPARRGTGAAPSHTEAAMSSCATSGALKGFEDMIPQFLDQVRVQYVEAAPGDPGHDQRGRPRRRSGIRQASRRPHPRPRGGLHGALHRGGARADGRLLPYAVGQKLSTIQAEVLQASVPVVQAWSRKLTSTCRAASRKRSARRARSSRPTP